VSPRRVPYNRWRWSATAFLECRFVGDAWEVRITIASGIYCEGPAVSRLEPRANPAPRPFPDASRSRCSSGQSLWKWRSGQYWQRGGCCGVVFLVVVGAFSLTRTSSILLAPMTSSSIVRGFANAEYFARHMLASSSSDVSGRIRFASSLFSAGSLTACFVPKNCARSLLLVPGLSYLLIRSLSSSSKVGENGAVSFHHSAAAPRNYAVILPRQNAGLVVASFSLHSFKKVRQRQYLR
jgi:hypothetical protein